MSKSIHMFQDEHGRVISWPSDRRRMHQIAILEHLSHLFDGGELYSEAAVMQSLQDHTEGLDCEMLRGELVDSDYLVTDGQHYWKAGSRPEKR